MPIGSKSQIRDTETLGNCGSEFSLVICSLSSSDWLANQIIPVWVDGWHKIFMTTRSHAELDFDLRSRIKFEVISLIISRLNTSLSDPSYRTLNVRYHYVTRKNVVENYISSKYLTWYIGWEPVWSRVRRTAVNFSRSTDWLVSKFLKINFFMHPLNSKNEQ